MKWLTKNAKLLECFGLFLILAGWFLNWRSVEHWSDAARKLDSFMQMITTSYHQMQFTANVRLEASVSRVLPQPVPSNDVDNNSGSYRLTWHSPEVRQRWLARAGNNLFSLDQFVIYLGQINDEFNLDGTSLLAEPRNLLNEIHIAIRQATDEKDVTPVEVPIPELQKLPIERANEIDLLSMKASKSVFNTYQHFEDLVRDKKQSRMFLYNIVFALGTVLTVFSKFLEWRNERGKKVVRGKASA
ncbi:MAG TPA: hypothetical protein VEY11_12960 [Pyrinomonadaceae bacterium]|nr:hypothetical protein [Pyrinomonadaceae bacterium]